MQVDSDFQDSMKKSFDVKERNKVWENFLKNKFSGRIISQLRFSDIDFTGVKFINIVFDKNVRFHNCIFINAEFKSVSFNKCSIRGSNFLYATMEDTKFVTCSITNNSFVFAKFHSESEFVECNFFGSSFISSEFNNSKIIKCWMYGGNFWSIKLDENTLQKDLIISPKNEKKTEIDQILVDSIHVGNIISNLYLTQNRFFEFIEETSKIFILILGRFPNENFHSSLPYLQNAIRDYKQTNYSPLVFNFEKPEKRDLIEIIILLATLSKYIIVDLSDPKSAPAEIQAILGILAVPIIPIIHKDQEVPATFSFVNKYNWVSDVIKYDDYEEIERNFSKIDKVAQLKMDSLKDYKKAEISYTYFNDL